MAPCSGPTQHRWQRIHFRCHSAWPLPAKAPLPLQLVLHREPHATHLLQLLHLALPPRRPPLLLLDALLGGRLGVHHLEDGLVPLPLCPALDHPVSGRAVGCKEGVAVCNAADVCQHLGAKLLHCFRRGDRVLRDAIQWCQHVREAQRRDGGSQAPGHCSYPPQSRKPLRLVAKGLVLRQPAHPPHQPHGRESALHQRLLRFSVLPILAVPVPFLPFALQAILDVLIMLRSCPVVTGTAPISCMHGRSVHFAVLSIPLQDGLVLLVELP
mmetsp:Transcript_34405/g.97472  ORF Transcript_34405/g.97472 Transcript_34405/m.97472 type:complete len:269 (-) Transcript_34405:2172-2978(-)